MADDDSRILGRMVEVDVKVALGPEGEINQRVPGQLLQHVIQKTDAGGDLVLPRSVEIHLDGNPRFPGGAFDHGLAHDDLRENRRPCSSNAFPAPAGTT